MLCMYVSFSRHCLGSYRKQLHTNGSQFFITLDK